jgi:regulator of chromosome condensation
VHAYLSCALLGETPAAHLLRRTRPRAVTPAVSAQVVPQLVWEPQDAGAQVVAVASGDNHVAALCRNGEVITWGCNERGQLGRIGSVRAAPAREEEAEGRDATPWRKAEFLQPAPMHLPVDLPARPSAIACGSHATFVIVADGAVYACGLNNWGQLGVTPHPHGEHSLSVPQLAVALGGAQVAAIAGGDHHTLALTREGAILAFGRQAYGRLGLPTVDTMSAAAVDQPEEAPVGGLCGAVRGIAAGVAVSGCFSDEECGVWFCGLGDAMQLAKPAGKEEDEAALRRAEQTKVFQAVNITQLEFGGQHTVMLGVPRPEAAPAPPHSEASRASPAPSTPLLLPPAVSVR